MSRGRGRADVEVVGLDHVQLAIPKGEEALARLFYAELLGLRPVAKPRALRIPGGCWFQGPGIALHLGVEEPFRPSRKAHPALLVADLERARRTIEAAGYAIHPDESGLPVRRLYVDDPFGNRIELVDARDGGFTDPRRRLARSNGDEGAGR